MPPQTPNDEPPVYQAPAPQPTTTPPQVPVNNSQTSIAAGRLAHIQRPSLPRSRRQLLAALCAIVIILLVAAVSYAALIVPNKPENVLKKAIANTLAAKQASFDSTVDTNSTSGSGVAYKIVSSGSADTEAKTLAAKINLTVSGVDIPLEARYVDSNFYLKAGDLSTLASLANSFDPSIGALANSLSAKIANKWIVFDSTLIKSAGLSCITDSNWSFSKDDIKLLQQEYAKHTFVTIQGSAKDTVNGQKATRYTLSIDDDKGAAYLNDSRLNNLSLSKTLDQCKKSTNAKSTPVKADHDKTPMTVWVANDKIVKLAGQTTPKDEKKSHTKGSFSVTINYKKVKVDKPSGAVPAVQILAEIESAVSSSPSLQSVAGGSGSAAPSVSPSSSNAAKDSKRKTDLDATQSQLEAYWADSGRYPTLAELNDANWRKTNMPSFDENIGDPDSSGGPKFAAQPAPKIYAYQTSGDQQYTLTAVLSDGSHFTKKDLNGPSNFQG